MDDVWHVVARGGEGICEGWRNSWRECIAANVLRGETQEAAVVLGDRERAIVKDAVLEAAGRFRQDIGAIAVCSNHVHIVCEYVEVPIGVVVGYYKNAGRKALGRLGCVGSVWTRGYDKRFCFDEKALKERIRYVEGHR